jgi:hypothetical protein
MNEETNPPEIEKSDERRVVEYGETLRRLVAEVLAPWVVHTVGAKYGASVGAAVALPATEAAVSIDRSLAAFFAEDIDQQNTTPLSIIRGGLQSISAHMESVAVPRPDRDPFDERANPADIYELGPLTWQDLGDDVHVAGLQWGAAKAFLHKRRHVR